MEHSPFSQLSPIGVAAVMSSQVQSVVDNVVMPLAKKVDPTDTGCYVVFWRRTDPDQHWVPAGGLAVGDVTTDKFMKYVTFAHEKAYRLSQHPDHILSFESWDESDPEKPKYPGAVRMDLDHVIISTSGFGWKFDELVGLIIGHSLGLLSVEAIKAAIKKSDNEHALKHFTEVCLIGENA